jgi:serine/threonine protein kinase
MIQQCIDGIEYRLQSPYDMSFLSKYGRVFKVFDDQDSGNICFGIRNGQERYFIKFAGAQTAAYKGSPSGAVTRLKSTVPVYRDLAHKNLIEYLWSEETGDGYAAAFAWAGGVCMGKQYPAQRARFLSVPDRDRVLIFDAILDFHIYAARRGYVAVDFYDGSILYDPAQKKTVICDIDCYQKGPITNTMGRMWGSSRFMSPEEYTLGAPIDEITNIFLMGAVAFALFGGEADRSIERWRLSELLYRVAKKAVSADRAERYAGLGAFKRAWDKAKER